MSKSKPDFIIIGAMKSATSTLHAQLDSQPGIFMTSLKEPNFFSDDRHYRRGLEWYTSLFAQAGPRDICGESSTHYTKLPHYPNTVARLREAVPDVRLIYVMRNPIDRLLSHYVHEWSERTISEPIEQAVRRLPELTDYSRYGMQILPYLNTFGSDRLLLVFFEKLTAAPQSELERICQFLGYTGRPKWQEENAHQNISRERMRIGPALKFLVENPILRGARRTLIPGRCREWVKGFLRMDSKPFLSPELIVHLKQVFDKDLTLVSSLVGFPITCDTWNTVAHTNIPEIKSTT